MDDERPEGPDSPEDADRPEPAEDAEPDKDAEDAEPDKKLPERPKAVAGVSPATQVGTVAAAVVVLLLVAVVLVVVDRGGERKPADPGATTVPSAPSSGYEPSRDEPLPPLPDFPSQLCPTAPLKRPLTVLAFNIHYATTPGGSVQLDRIADEITAWKPDVVLLQEVDEGRPRTGGVRQAEVLGKATGMQWVYGGNQRSRGTGPIGNAILSRYPISEWSNTPLPVAGGKEQRGLLHALVNVDGTEISVYSTHFDHHSGGARVAQAQATLQVLAADARPKILGGDLNTGPGGAPVRALRGGGLGDAWAVGEGNGMTVPASSPRRRIDFVLHDGWFTPLQAAVLRSAVSDHRAVWTRIEFRKELGCFDIGG